MTVFKIINNSGCIPTVTGMVLRVSSLKNVANTASCVYAGDVSVSSLEKVVKLMAKHQVGHEIVDEQACLAADFLNSFAGLYKAPIL